MSILHDLLHKLSARGGGREPDRAACPAPPWPAERGRARVVVENEDAACQWAAAGLLEAAGYDVASCGGPRHLPGHECALVAHDRCPLVDGADLVVSSLGISDPANRAVLTALRRRRSQIPVIVEVTTPRLEELHATVPGCRTIPYPVTPHNLLAAVDAALPGVLCTRSDDRRT